MDNTHSRPETYTRNRNNMDATTGKDQKPHKRKNGKNIQNQLQTEKTTENTFSQTQAENNNKTNTKTHGKNEQAP